MTVGAKGEILVVMDDFEKFYLIAANFLSYRPRSEKEVRDKLGMKKVPAEILEKIVMTLKQQRYINDEQFAKEWVLSRSKYRLKSRRIIKIELIKKGIDPEIIEKALNAAAEDEEVQMDDLGKAKKLAEGRINRYSHLPKNEIYQKLGGFLARRGFNWDICKKAIDDILNVEYNK